MDSKQLASLSTSGTQRPAPITFSEVYGLISQQILIGKMSIESLKLQKEYVKLLKLQHDHSIKLLDEKIKLVNLLNDLREKQLVSFDESRQDECNGIIDEINGLDIPSASLIALSKKIEKSRSELGSLVERITMLQNALPNEKLLDHYAVTLKKDAVTNGTCSEEFVLPKDGDVE